MIRRIRDRIANFAVKFAKNSVVSKVSGFLLRKFGPHRLLGRIGWIALAIALLLPALAWLTGYYFTTATTLGIIVGGVGIGLLILNRIVVYFVEKWMERGVDEGIKLAQRMTGYGPATSTPTLPTPAAGGNSPPAGQP